MSQLLTPREVAEMLCVSEAWVSDHARGRRRPELPSVKMGKARRFRSEDVAAFIEQCVQIARDQAGKKRRKAA